MLMLDNIKQKYLSKLKDAGSVGLRCCQIEPEDELNVLELFSDDTYYFSEDENGALWLNWE